MSMPLSDPPKRAYGPAIPPEGHGGYSETWFAVCLSSSLGDKPKHVPFLDGQITLFRTRSGIHAVSSYCPHLGADLSVGRICNGRIQCAFHGWEFDTNGRCRATGIGDPPPNAARLFTFPTQDRYGFVWVFNGLTPNFRLPNSPFKYESIYQRAGHLGSLTVDPWVVGAQTLDLQHFSLPHDLAIHNNPADQYHAGEYYIGMGFTATTQAGDLLKLRATIYGTSCFYQQATLNGRSFLWVTGLSIPRRGECNAFFNITASRAVNESQRSINGFLDRAAFTMMGMMSDDAPIMQTIHFRPGRLTASDTTLSKYLNYVRAFPRSHHSEPFIN